MKKLILHLLILFPSFCIGQNLVPNPSFEEYVNCGCVIDGPYVPSVFNTVKSWITPTHASPDFDHLCFSYVPQNMFGFQYPKTGDGYVDIDVFNAGFFPQYREYVEVELTDTLKRDKNYCISFYINLSDSSTYAVDKIGLYLSDTLISQNTDFNLNFVPQIENPHGNLLIDKINWIEISGNYIAHGGEKFITIGNFYNDSNTDTIIVFGGATTLDKEAIYYLDDVSVYLCDTIATVNELVIINAFTPNGDGINDVFHVKGNNIKELHAKIINRWGQELYKWDDVQGGWDGKHKEIYVSAGAYFYVVTVVYEDGSVVEKKGALELIR